ncbi:MAG: class I SAM-dependent methyltransferase [Planctomycetota bacterium]
MAKKSAAGSKKSKKKSAKKVKAPALTAKTADRHALYQASVQNVEAEIDFVDKTYRKLRGKHARLLREDFCGTGNTSCEWVRRRKDNTAVGLDIDQETLDWGVDHCVTTLPEQDRSRVTLINRDVLTPGDAVGMDAVLAMNFSYWLFQTREEMVRYLRSVRESLADDGILFQDFYGGSEAASETEERRKCSLPNKGGSFTYVWDQNKFNPITGEMFCRIHFEFKDGTRMTDGFTYTWRLWTLPEIRELLAEAGFSKTTVYWEGDELDDDGEPTGEGNGIFKPTMQGTADPAYICYVVSEK